ncbi:hypothetical protein [Roseomonas chloroacetimidivorans]|uniref:hypothetical protein n=1 Tax=Roseomonas chloroacetimidivorans TaxID=1766656 RepID=UPI003C74B669
MLTCTATIQGISPYSPSRYVDPSLKKAGEKHDEFDQRIWREKAHTDAQGRIVIPFMSFKKALDGAARLTPRKIKGRGQQTYGAQFKSGVLLTEPLTLPVLASEVRGETFMCSSTGDSRGVGGRVPRTFPMIDEWGGTLTFYIVNPTIDRETFATYLREAGQFIGIGRFRPENGGVNGRFKVDATEWAEV